MTDHLFALMSWALGQGFAAGRWPRPGGELLTGCSPRLQIYPTADRRFLAAAPLEQRFWARFAELIGLETRYRDDRRDPLATTRRVSEIIRTHDAAHWQTRFAGADVCCSIVTSLEEAVRDPHFIARGLFASELDGGGAGRSIPALPVPLAPVFRELRAAGYPRARRGEPAARQLIAPRPLTTRAPVVAHPIPHLLCSTRPRDQDQSPPSPQARNADHDPDDRSEQHRLSPAAERARPASAHHRAPGRRRGGGAAPRARGRDQSLRRAPSRLDPEQDRRVAAPARPASGIGAPGRRRQDSLPRAAGRPACGPARRRQGAGA